MARADIKSYENDGYIVVRGIFSRSECQELIRLSLELADPTFKIKMNPDRTSPGIKRFINDGRIADIVEALHGNMSMDWLMCQIHFRMPNTPFTKGWNPHQDNHYTQHPYGMGATAIVALEDTDRKNGCLYAYPGSHKLPLLYHQPHPTFNPNGNPGSMCAVPCKFIDKKTDLYFKQGDLYVQHGNLIHGSYSNDSPTRSRLHLGISCIVRGQPYNTGGNNSNRLPQPLRG